MKTHFKNILFFLLMIGMNIFAIDSYKLFIPSFFFYDLTLQELSNFAIGLIGYALFCFMHYCLLKKLIIIMRKESFFTNKIKTISILSILGLSLLPILGEKVQFLSLIFFLNIQIMYVLAKTNQVNKINETTEDDKKKNKVSIFFQFAFIQNLVLILMMFVLSGKIELMNAVYILWASAFIIILVMRFLPNKNKNDYERKIYALKNCLVTILVISGAAYVIGVSQVKNMNQLSKFDISNNMIQNIGCYGSKQIYKFPLGYSNEKCIDSNISYEQLASDMAKQGSYLGYTYTLSRIRASDDNNLRVKMAEDFYNANKKYGEKTIVEKFLPNLKNIFNFNMEKYRENLALDSKIISLYKNEKYEEIKVLQEELKNVIKQSRDAAKSNNDELSDKLNAEYKKSYSPLLSSLKFK